GADRFLAPAPSAALVNGLLELIATHAGPGDTLAVLPEGSLLNCLSRRANPTPYTSVMPPEAIVFGEPAILAAYQSRPPDLVAVLPRDLSEYGRAGFGQDHLVGLWEWLTRNYEQVAVVSAGQADERALLLRRKPE
ncbi:MAG TPA: hypothetical protein VFD43_07280, partial [Planctomycetota bacterium]|nr:hypothetical protein [Planctomycetota bacterium]